MIHPCIICHTYSHTFLCHTSTHTFPFMYVEDAVQHLQPAKSGGTAAVAALSLEDTPPPPTLWVIVELERPVFCPANSICVASKLEVNAATFVH